jgi:type II restriction enzyme
MNKDIQRKINEAIDILNQVKSFDPLLTENRRRRIGLALLALANLRPRQPWAKAQFWSGDEKSSWSLTTREIISFWNENYGLNISSGSYDDVRRKVLIFLVEAGIVIRSAGNPDATTNNPTRRYALSEEAGQLVRAYGSPNWINMVNGFLTNHGDFSARIERHKNLPCVPVRLPSGEKLNLSVGEHNEIQKAVIEDFLPRFLKDPRLLYLGDTSNKLLFLEEKKLSDLGIPMPDHDKLPDIIAIDSDRQWVFLIEAVHSSNPISRTRHIELEDLLANCKLPIVFVSAFKDRRSFRNWVAEISWETEVWLADSPEHMIHFNGDKFLGPHMVV